MDVRNFGVHIPSFEPHNETCEMSWNGVIPKRVPKLSIALHTSKTDFEIIIQGSQRSQYWNSSCQNLADFGLAFEDKA